MNFEHMMFYLLILLTVPTSKSEVDDWTFYKCRSFFYKNQPPYGIYDRRKSCICQKYKNDYHFATLYSTIHRIPVYSAYTLDKFDCNNPQPPRRSNWFIEPQLSNWNNAAEMSTEQRFANIYKQVQAINLYYRYTNYDRGHLNPRFYQCDERRTATFTLTNAVPQVPYFNQQIWKQMEQRSKYIMREKCNFPGARRFFVTGAIPSNNKIPEQDQWRLWTDINRVTIPSRIWTAACCDSTNAESPFDRHEGFSFGYIGDNGPYSNVTSFLVPQLEKELAYQYGIKSIDIFRDSDTCFSSSKTSADAVLYLDM